MSNMLDIVTIDGPSGVGKSTISKKLAEKLSYTYLDTGAMYRTVALACQKKNAAPEDESAVQAVLANLKMELLPPLLKDGDTRVLLDKKDVSQEIRTPEASMRASKFSALPQVRAKLTALQQQIGEKGKIVAEGRDTGTVVFPDARNKFYLDATPEERTRRRVEQLRKTGKPVDEKKIREQIIERDHNDSNRAIAPLQAAADAIHIDSTTKNPNEIIALMIEYIESKKT